jgi:ketosteroid isomerase-like protein
MANAANEQLVHRFLAATRENDREELLRLFHPDLVWIIPKGAIPPYGGTHRGAEKIADMMLASVGGTFVPGSMTHRILLTMSDDRHVMMELNLRAKTPDGREYDNYYVFVFECRNGRITELREHVDTTYAAKFFGAA